MTTYTHHDTEETQAAGAPARPSEGAVFAELYERYFPELYDFVVRTMGETERASEVVTTAFVQTLLGFRQQRTTAPIDAILFTAARNLALDKLREKSGSIDPAVKTFLQERFVTIDAGRLPDPAGTPDRDLAELVWQLLSAHPADEYSLIDLVLRRGIPVESLAAAMDYPLEDMRSAVEGMQSNVEQWITTALLIHRASAECAGLNAALDAVGHDAPSAELRAAVQQHASGCETCPQFRARYPSAATTFAALASVPPPDGLREAVWLEITESLGSSKPPAAARERSLLAALDAPARVWNAASLRQKAIAGGVIALISAVFIAIAILLAPSSGIGIDDPQGFASTTHEIGEPSTENVVAVTWEAQPKAVAFSVEWSQEDDTLPDDVADLAGSATATKSPELDPGDWYFHLRTQGPEGQWTSTVHIGPFVIIAGDEDGPSATGGSPTPRATRTPVPTAQPATPTPAPEPTGAPFEPTPAPQPDPTPVVTDPPAPTPIVIDGSCPADVPQPEAAAPSDEMGPVQTVRQYYLLINEGRYAEAYDLLTVDLQQSPDFYPFEMWVGGFATTTVVNPLTVVLVEQGVDYAVVAIEVVSVDSGPGGETQYLFQGTWVLVTDGGPWKLAGADIGVSVC